MLQNDSTNHRTIITFESLLTALEVPVCSGVDSMRFRIPRVHPFTHHLDRKADLNTFVNGLLKIGFNRNCRKELSLLFVLYIYNSINRCCQHLQRVSNFGTFCSVNSFLTLSARGSVDSACNVFSSSHPLYKFYLFNNFQFVSICNFV